MLPDEQYADIPQPVPLPAPPRNVRLYWGDTPQLCPLTQPCRIQRRYIPIRTAEPPLVEQVPHDAATSPPSPARTPSSSPEPSSEAALPTKGTPIQLDSAPLNPLDDEPEIAEALEAESVAQEPEVPPPKDCSLCGVICKVLNKGDKESEQECKSDFKAVNEGEMDNKELVSKFNDRYGDGWRKRVLEELKNKQPDEEE